MTTVSRIVLGGPTAPWERLGLAFRRNVAVVGGVGLEMEPAEAPGIVRLVLAGAPDIAVRDLDGVPIAHETAAVLGDLDEIAAGATDHPLRPVGVDHVVVMTSSLDRTVEAVSAGTGEPLRRVREAGPVRQGFFRLGGVILEVVESPRVAGDHASLWGLVITVADLDAAVAMLGLPDPRPAVQPGRRIVTVPASAGCAVPLALMSPHVRPA